MRFPAPLIPATLIRRYKRFLADVVLGSGETLTVHVANPGAMTGLAIPGARIFVSKSDNARRKLTHSWELVEADLGSGPELVGVNTGYPNALKAAQIPVQAKMMTICDIYDALSASDRPYKRAVSADRALDILKLCARSGEIDSELLRLFMGAQIYRLPSGGSNGREKQC